MGRNAEMTREQCYRCFWPRSLCWCPSIEPMPTRTRFVFLMHPKEFKREKLATGRLTHLCLPNSEIHMGIGFDDHDKVQALLADPQYQPMLLYPGEGARDLGDGDLTLGDLGGRELLVVLLDATWMLARKMLRMSPSLQRLPRIMFTPSQPSRYVIKRQPQEGCLATLEATHELLLSLDRAGLDEYSKPDQLLDLFARVQDYQLRRASDPNRKGYRLRHHTMPEDRVAEPAPRKVRRRRFLPPAAPGS